METIKVNRPTLEDMIIHKGCRLELVENPFVGGLMLKCVEHDVYLMEILE